MNINEIKILCNELSAISSTIDKKTWLKNHKCDELDIIFKFLCDPSKVTGLDKDKMKKEVPDRPACENLDTLLKYITLHNTGSDVDIGITQSSIKYLANDNEEIVSWLIALVTKNLKLGINTKTLNIVYGKGYIPVHEVQLGSPRDKLRLKKDEAFWLSQKLNGVRATFVNGKMISRQGKVFSGLEHIIADLNAIDPKLVFDGEVIRKNTDGVSDNENFRIGTGILNSDDADKSCLEFVVFDIMTLEQFTTQSETVDYVFRRKALDECEDTSNVRFLKSIYYGSDQSKIDELLAYADAQGWEGLMLNKNAPYEFKRTTNLIKIKTFHFSDLRVVGYTEGDNKYTGTLGALIVEYKGNTVNVGSGFTDEQRAEYWADRENLVGRIVEVKYKEESTDKDTGMKSLQFPIFSQFRDDKDEESIE